LVTSHPVTLENNTAEEQFQELLNAIDKLEDTNIIFTKANSDTDGRVINLMIENKIEIQTARAEFSPWYRRLIGLKGK